MNRKGVLHSCINRLRPELLLLLLSGLCLAFSLGCGGSAKTPSPSIAFAQGAMAPPASVVASSTVQFAATVTNDSQNEGVSWLLTCSASNCGSITRHTASGIAATYIAPPEIPTGGAVTVTANSTADPTQSVTATLQITPIVYGPISVSFSPAPPSSMVTGATAAFIPVVTNDRPNSQGNPSGATLSVTCGSPNQCGHFGGDTYFAPSAVPSGGTVTITATSVADPTQSASATVTITQAPITVTITQPPPNSLQAGAATNIVSHVTGDPNTAGVEWTATCGGSACGSFVPMQTSANIGSSYYVSVTYTAPAVVPPSGTVTIMATAKGDPTGQTFATAAVTVNSAELRNDLLHGQYAFLLTGVNLYQPWAIAGILSADGNGNITLAEESVPGQGAVLQSISGSYFIGSDGRGTITLNGLPSFLWNNGQQIFKVSVVDSTHAFLEEFDGTGSYAYQAGSGSWTIQSHGSTLSGTLDLQTTSNFNTPPTGAYAFALSGATSLQNSAAYYGGVLTASATGTITAFNMDRFIGSTTDAISSASYGSDGFTGPDTTYGQGTVTIGPYAFDYYMVDSGHLVLLARSGPLTAGHMYAQSSAVAPMIGSYVFTVAGSKPIYASNGSGMVNGNLPQTSGGSFSCDASGNMNGYLNTNDNGTVELAQVSGTCAMSANGRGVLTSNGGAASSYALYPTSSHGLLMFQLDNGRSGIGNAFLQNSTAVDSSAVQGKYAMKMQRLGYINVSVTQPTGPWEDLTGQLLADGVSSLTGTVDEDQVNGLFIGTSGFFWTQTVADPVSGSFTPDAQGSFTGSLTTNAIGPMPQFFYVIDASTVLVQESDTTPAVGILQQQKF